MSRPSREPENPEHMTNFRTLLAGVAVALIFSSTALAQAPTPPAYDKDQDLPVDAPILKVPPAPPKPPTPPPTTDETPPTIYGKDMKSESGSIIYVLDVSYSMSWAAGDYTGLDGKSQSGARIDHARVQLIRSIRALPKNFKFNVIAFDCMVYVWCQDLQPADDTHKTQAEGWVNNLQPDSSTGTGPAVVQALLCRANKLIVLLTDGAPNCGAGDQTGDESCREAHLSQIRWANQQGATINVFGIGASGVFRDFCVSLASQNGGSYTDVW